MKYKSNILLNYMSSAPFALAFERYLECRIYLDLSLNPPILDIGCGDGIFASVLFAEQIDTGVDPNGQELKQAWQNGSYKELIQCRGDVISKPDRFYCTIFSNSVLEHISNLTPVLREAYRLLTVGGHFYFTVPSHLFEHYTLINQILMFLGLRKEAEKYRRWYNGFWKQYHAYELSKWQFLAQQAGFEVEDAFYYDTKPVAMLNDILAPLGIFGFLTKRLTGRWVIFPKLRRILIYPLYLFFHSILQDNRKSEQGALVFISLTKK